MDEHLRILATSQKMIHDLLSIMRNKEHDGQPFEIGCKCNTQLLRDQLFDVMSAVFRYTPGMQIEKREIDFVICVKRVVDKMDVTVSEASPKEE